MTNFAEVDAMFSLGTTALAPATQQRKQRQDNKRISREIERAILGYEPEPEGDTQCTKS